MPELPTGTVTFLFTDVEGSTRLLQSLGDGYGALLERHNELMRGAVESGGGVVFGSEGDAMFAVFRTAPAAVAASVAAQRAMAAEAWPSGAVVRVRMGLHTGEGALAGDGYVGIDLHRVARVAAAGHGGQVLVSATTRALVDKALPDGVWLRDLGPHRLKDLPDPENLFQLVIPALPADFPPLRTLDARPNNLPVQLTGFIGRDREVAELKGLLRQARLVTLTGPGGTGKTRLSLRVAAELLPDFADGVWFVPLDTITDPALVAPTIANALSVEEGETPTDELLARHLSNRELLLVLDNFEQVMGAGPLVPRLLVAAPKLRVVVTSREVLHVSGEHEFPVPPLSLPDPDHLPSAEALSQYDAVALFIQRARAVNASFGVTDQNAPAVAEICTRLDGLPLAIELAAARLKLFPPDALLARLESSLRFLRGGARDLPTRQQTLRDAIAWSHDLLDPAERTLFRRLSIFMGGWSLAAAEAVVAEDDAGDLDVVDGLASLVDKSLVRQRQMDDGDLRFRMLETIREFSRERLVESGEEEEIAGRHEAHFLALAQEAGAQLAGSGQVAALDRLAREHHNLRTAFNHAMEGGDVEAALRAAGAIWRYLQVRGHLGEGRGWLVALLERPEAEGRTLGRALALNGLGGLCYWQTDYDAAGRCYEEALSIAREIGDRRLVAEVLYSLTYIERIRGDVAKAQGYAREVLGIFEELGDRSGAAYAKVVLSGTSLYEVDLEAARELADEALPVFLDSGDAFGVGQIVHLKACISREQGRHEESLEEEREALARLREIGDISGQAMVLGGIAATLVKAGRVEEGLRVARAAVRAEEEVGGRAPILLRGFEDARDLARTAGIEEDAIERAFAGGAELGLEDAVREQLDAGEPAAAG
ncbi:MAG: tetratricopeptide repeat protein [Actinobacteria bacterium]|nr:tetratricopeptide repeat protein [Actinomycetota bacterium]